MIEQAEWIAADDKARYSELTILTSPQGWYIGTIYHGEDGDDVAALKRAYPQMRHRWGAPTRLVRLRVVEDSEEA